MIRSLLCHTLHLHLFKPDLLQELGEIQNPVGVNLRVLHPHLMKVWSFSDVFFSDMHNVININAKENHIIVMNMLASTFSFLLFQDGGLLINNPTALAIHECKCLWPNTPLQCVLSLGTGRYETAGKNGTTYTSLKAKLTNVISSATDTEGRLKTP